MRDRAAHEGDILHAGKPDVGDVLAAPAQQPVVLLALQARSDPLRGHHFAAPFVKRRARAVIPMCAAAAVAILWS